MEKSGLIRRVTSLEGDSSSSISLSRASEICPDKTGGLPYQIIRANLAKNNYEQIKFLLHIIEENDLSESKSYVYGV